MKAHQQAANVNGSYEDVASRADGDASAALTAGQQVISARDSFYNGATWDRVRGNTETGSLITLTTSSVNGADFTNYNARGIVIVLDVTAITGTSFTITIQGKDPTSAKYYTLLVSAAVSTVSTNIYRIYPGLTAAANATASDVVPRTFRVISTNTAISALTATCAGSLIL